MNHYNKLALLGLCLIANSAEARNFQVQDLLVSGSAINNHGLVGSSANLNPAILDTHTGQLTEINASPYYIGANISGMNNGGHAVGNARVRFNENVQPTFYYRTPEGRYYPLALPHPAGRYRDIRVWAVNEQLWKVGDGTLANASGEPIGSNAVLWLPDSGGVTSTAHVLPCPIGSYGSGASTVTDDGIIGGYCGATATIWFWGYAADMSNYLPAEIRVSSSGMVQTISRTEFLDGARCNVEKITDNHKYSINCSSRFGSYSFISPAGSSLPLIQFSTKNDVTATVFDINANGSAILSNTSSGPNALYYDAVNSSVQNLSAEFGVAAALCVINDQEQILCGGRLLSPIH